MKIAIGSDHAGFILKKEITNFLLKRNFEVKEFDAFSSVKIIDYPDIALKVCLSVVKKKTSFGILVCGTGVGMSIAANKIRGIKCSLCNDLFSAQKAKEHNDANVLALGGKLVASSLGLMIVSIFLKSKFEKGRHEIRTKKIESIEKNQTI